MVIIGPAATIAEDLRLSSCIVTPSEERVSSRCNSLEFHGLEQVSVEAARGDINAVDLDACTIGVAGEGDTLCGRRDLHLREVANGIGHHLFTAVEGVFHAVRRAIGRLIVDGHGGSADGCELVYDLGAARGFEHTTAHHTIGVDELTAEVFVLQQLAEDGDECDVGNNHFSAGQQSVEVVVLLHVHDVVEHVATAIEGVVGVEHDETETSAVAMAEGLDVVAQPVVAAQIHLCRHVVHVLVDVEHLADILIDAVVVGVGRQRDELLIYLVIAALLHVERVGRDFKLVDFIVVPAVVGIDVVLVVGLANVQDTDVLAIDELMHGLIRLHIDVDARGLYDGLNGRVFDSAAVVVAAIANLQCAVVDVGLGCKERIGQFLLAAQFL